MTIAPLPVSTNWHNLALASWTINNCEPLPEDPSENLCRAERQLAREASEHAVRLLASP